MKEKSKGRWSRDGLSKVESKRSMMISFQSILSSRWSRELQSIRCIQLAWMRRTLFQYLILRLIQVGRGEADLSLFLEASREDSATDLRLMDFAVLYSESFLNSWSKVVISRRVMALVENLSTGPSLTMRTLNWSIRSHSSYQWPMLAQVRLLRSRKTSIVLIVNARY